MQRFAVWCLVGLVLAGVAPEGVYASKATTKGDLAYSGTAAVVTGGSLLTPAFFLFPFLGVGELGGAIVKGVCDPPGPSSCPAVVPDTVNFSSQANEPLLVIPALIGATPGFTQAADVYFLSMSLMIQSFKDIEDSFARLAGAKLVGSPTDVANQTLWLNQFEQLNIAQSIQARQDLLVALGVFQQDYPALFNFVPPTSEVLNIKNQEAAGIFPAFEQDILNTWMLTPREVQFAELSFASTTDQEIINFGPLSVGQAFRRVAGLPEPSTVALLLPWLGVWGAYSRYKRRRSF